MYTIGQVAKQVGVGIGAIRFYERKGLLDSVARNEQNIRLYTEQEITWLIFLRCLRETGISVEETKKYHDLVRAGTATLPERITLKMSGFSYCFMVEFSKWRSMMRIFRKFSFWLPLLSLAICMVNLSGEDDKNLLLFLTSPVLIWLNPQLTDLNYSMENELQFQLIEYAIHFFSWLVFALLFDWLLARRRAK